MNERWMKAYLAALAGVCADHQVDDAISAVQWAIKVADASEAHLDEHEKKVRADAAAEVKRRIDEATAKVLATRFYKIELSKFGLVELEVDTIVGQVVRFKPHTCKLTVGNLFEVAAGVDGEDGWIPSPRGDAQVPCEATQAAAPTLREPLSAETKEEAIRRIRLAVPHNYDRSPSDLITDLADVIGAELDLARLLP